MKTTTLAVPLVFFAASFFLAGIHVEARAAGLDAIAIYNGQWHSDVTHYKTAYSKAREETSDVRNDCWRSAAYYVCDQFVSGISVALIVYTYDSKKNIYHPRPVMPDGSSPSSGTLLIAGNTWTYPWQDKDGSKTVYIRIINTFLDRNTIQFRQEFSYDGAHWTVTARGLEHRVPAK